MILESTHLRWLLNPVVPLPGEQLNKLVFVDSTAYFLWKSIVLVMSVRQLNQQNDSKKEIGLFLSV
jgi:hypothetical protein